MVVSFLFPPSFFVFCEKQQAANPEQAQLLSWMRKEIEGAGQKLGSYKAQI